MLLEKYCPSTSREMVGNRIAAAGLAAFLGQWKKGQALMVVGETGVGKTLLVRLVGRELGYEIIEVGADQERTLKDMDFLIRASKQGGLFGAGSKKIFLVDELDQMESAKAIVKLVEESSHPVILITSDQYDRKLYALRKNCRVLPLQKVPSESIAAFLRKVCEKEGLDVEQGHLEQMARMSNGDLRAALIDLEIFCSGRHALDQIGYRERSQNMFDALKVIFKTTSFENAMTALNNCEDPEDLHRWIAENIPAEYEGADLAKAYDMIAEADLFHARIIKRQSWSLQKYFFELSAAGVALSKSQDSRKALIAKYTRPRFQGRTKSEAALRIAPKLHVSSGRVKEYKQLISKLAKNRKMLEELEISREDIGWL